MSKIGNTFKTNLHTNSKAKQEIYYFLAGQGMEADSMASAKTAGKMYNK